MLRGVVVVPGAPALVPELMGEAWPELGAVRHACSRALAGLLADLLAGAGSDPPGIVVRGPGADLVVDATPEISFAEFGRDVRVAALRPSETPPATDLPTPVMVARYLVARSLEHAASVLPARKRATAELTWRTADWGTVGGSAGAVLGRRLREETRAYGLVLVLDGAAAHGPKAPHAEDSRAESSDTEAWTALASGDPAALDRLDLDLATHLGSTAPHLYPLLRESVAGERWRAELLWRGAPYGVGWAVARWWPEQGEADRAQPEQAEVGRAQPEQADPDRAQPEQAEADRAQPEQAEADRAQPEPASEV